MAFGLGVGRSIIFLSPEVQRELSTQDRKRAIAASAVVRPATRTEAENGSAHRRRSAGLHGGNHRGKDPFPRMDRGQMGDPVLASEGLHARLHHRVFFFKQKTAYDIQV